jgi:hypothetical protein
MRESDIQVKVSVTDDSSKGLASAEASMSRFGDSTKNFAKVAGASLLAVGAVAMKFGKDAFFAFAEAEASGARVDSMLASMGKKGLEAKESLNAMADSALKLGFDNEQAAEGIAKFFRATGDLTKAQYLNATAMDLARGKNIDLASAQNIITLALAGSTRELKAMGITVDENATAMDNLKMIHETYAGQSVAYAQTTKGSMDILTQAFGELQETAGQSVAVGLAPLSEQLAVIASSEST